MLLKLIGWIYIISGVIFLFQPERLRNKLKKQSVKKLKKWFFWLALAIGFLLIKGTWGVPGLLAKILMFCGFIALIKAIYYVKGKATDKLIEWWLDQPLKTFRIWAVVMIVFGGIVLSA